MSHGGWKPGRWSAICDVCGFRYHSDAMQKRWDGLMVCKKDFESRHPMDFLKGRAEKITPPWTRPEQADTFVSLTYADTLTCTALGSTAVVEFAVVGCAVVNRPLEGLGL